jgi:hypothetical protein
VQRPEVVDRQGRRLLQLGSPGPETRGQTGDDLNHPQLGERRIERRRCQAAWQMLAGSVGGQSAGMDASLDLGP